jgi:hypothetical protein
MPEARVSYSVPLQHLLQHSGHNLKTLHTHATSLEGFLDALVATIEQAVAVRLCQA